MLSFIHLSDIHFHKYSGDAYDIDHDLRCEIIRDISYEYRKKISTIDGILICGDIAFSGDEQQYNSATTFLSVLAGLSFRDVIHGSEVDELRFNSIRRISGTAPIIAH